MIGIPICATGTDHPLLDSQMPDPLGQARKITIYRTGGKLNLNDSAA